MSHSMEQLMQYYLLAIVGLQIKFFRHGLGPIFIIIICSSDYHVS